MMTTPIQVAELIYGFGIEGGGAGRFAAELASQLDRKQFEPSIWALWSTGSTLERQRLVDLNESGVGTYTATIWKGQSPYANFWNAVRGLRAHFRIHPVQVLHSHSEFGDMAALGLRALGLSPALIRTVHNGHPLEWRKRPLRRLLLTNTLYPMLFWAEIGVNKAIAARLEGRMVARLLNKRSRCIHNAINLERFTIHQPQPKRVRSLLGLPSGAWLVGSIGRLAKGKGFEDLLRAAALLKTSLPQAHFIIVGDGELRDALQKSAKDLGVDSRVTFIGARADVELLMSGMDLLVSASLWEGLSTTILESMAAGVPVLATDIPGNREIIEPEVNGWLVQPRSPNALASAIQRAYFQHAERDKMVQPGKIRAAEFSLPGIVAEYQELYLEAASR